MDRFSVKKASCPCSCVNKIPRIETSVSPHPPSSFSSQVFIFRAKRLKSHKRDALKKKEKRKKRTSSFGKSFVINSIRKFHSRRRERERESNRYSRFEFRRPILQDDYAHTRTRTIRINASISSAARQKERERGREARVGNRSFRGSEKRKERKK